jgi:hypothetical protein
MMMSMDHADDANATPPDDLDAVSQAAETAPRTSPPRRPIHPLRLAVIAGLLAIVVLVVVYGRVYVKRAARLRVQQACLDYSASPDQVVYEEEPHRARELIVRGGDYLPVATGDAAAGGGMVVGHVPGVWRDMRQWALPSQPEASGAVLFLHERHTHAGGKHVLVCVEADRAARKLRVTLIYPGASSLDPVAITNLDLAPAPQPDLVILKSGGEPFAAKLPEVAGERADLRFFAGQFDTIEAARFNLPYEFNGRRGELDCWLEDERVVYYVERRFAKK